jgi:hypothetical protein
MATRSFREDIRRARLEAISAPKQISKPEAKPVEVKSAVVADPKTNKIKKEME